MKLIVHLKSGKDIEVEEFESATERAPMTKKQYTVANISELIVSGHASYVFESATRIFAINGGDVLYFESVKD